MEPHDDAAPRGSGAAGAADEPGGFPHTPTWGRSSRTTTAGGPEYGAMIDALRTFLDDVAGARIDPATSDALRADLARWSGTLADHRVGERDQLFARRTDLAGRGQTMAPALRVVAGDDREVSGTVTFGRYFLGGNGAAHGGAIPLLFDEVLGRLANTGRRPPARTAYLHVNYRSITPIDVELQVTGRVESTSGRKHVLRAELRHGDVLCADAEGLFVELLPGQP